MINTFNQTLEAVQEKLQAILEKAASLETRASILRDLHWGEKDALKSILPLCTEAGDLAMTTRVLQDTVASCRTLSGLEALASRTHDLHARASFLEEGILQEEQSVRDRLQGIMTRLR